MIREALLMVVCPIVFGYAVGACVLSGCASLLPAVDDPELASLNSKLAGCRAEARAWETDAGLSPESAYMKYEDCKRREGVEGVGAQ